MIAELTRAEDKQDSIAVTGWVPHWMFAKWKLRFLDDPKGVYGAAETVNSIGSKGLEAKAPEVAAFLKKFQWASKDEIGEVMLAIQRVPSRMRRPRIGSPSTLSVSPSGLLNIPRCLASTLHPHGGFVKRFCRFGARLSL